MRVCAAGVRCPGTPLYTSVCSSTSPAQTGAEKTAAGGGQLWLIQTDQTQKLRIINGRYRHKAGNARLLVGAVSFWLVPLLPPTR